MVQYLVLSLASGLGLIATKKGRHHSHFMHGTQSGFSRVMTKSNVEFLALRRVWHCIGIYQRKILGQRMRVDLRLYSQ